MTLGLVALLMTNKKCDLFCDICWLFTKKKKKNTWIFKGIQDNEKLKEIIDTESNHLTSYIYDLWYVDSILRGWNFFEVTISIDHIRDLSFISITY